MELSSLPLDSKAAGDLATDEAVQVEVGGASGFCVQAVGGL